MLGLFSYVILKILQVCQDNFGLPSFSGTLKSGSGLVAQRLLRPHGL